MNLTEEQIDTELNNYVKKKKNENNYYHNVSKNNEEFKVKNRQRANDYYAKNKELRKKHYDENKEFMGAKSLYNYYQKKDKIDIFITKHPIKHSLLVDKGHI